MRRIHVVIVVVAVVGAIGGAAAGSAFQAEAVAPQPAPPSVCDASAAQLRTTLYFGTTKPKGTVSELEWQLFLRDEVTSRFPDGLTAWDAQGQWRAPGSSTIDQERTKVLLIVHADADKARKAVLDVIANYRKAFEQHSVLWETARVCVSS